MSWGHDFAGGTGEPNDPFRIATAEQLTSIGSDPNLLSKHFVLVVDIDLDPNLPGGRVFDRAVIAPEASYTSVMVPQMGHFSGDFDGSGHSIRHLTIREGQRFAVGLFGGIGASGQVRNLGVEQLSITRVVTNSVVGGLAGYNHGLVHRCHATGTLSSDAQAEAFGGLVGRSWEGRIAQCYADCVLRAHRCMATGGLVGDNDGGEITMCYASGIVDGVSVCGGLVARNSGRISDCHASASIGPGGGLVAVNAPGTIVRCYSIGRVPKVGASAGLVATNGQVSADHHAIGSVVGCFWDTETSGITTSEGGTGLTTAQMMRQSSFAGWGFNNVWTIREGKDYPRLQWEQ